ncbi:MAG: hypothetical protein DRI56_13050 [Chloroflexota bacterium]|nr:MAG: hypothetical protein DRI56_13050 [Chloroflexota bacterium]
MRIFALKTLLIAKLLRIALLLTILLSPLYVLRWSYLGIPTTFLENLIGLTVVLWIIFRIGVADYSWPGTGIDGMVGLVLMACGAGILATPDLRGGLGILKAYFLEPILFSYAVIDGLRRDVVKYREIIWSIIYAGLWLSLLGIIQVVSGTLIFSPQEAAAGRAHAVYNSGNALALFIGPAISLLVGEILESAWLRKRRRSFVRRIFEASILGVLLLAMFLTKSTGGIIAAFSVLLIQLGSISLNGILSKVDIERVLLLGLGLYLIAHLTLFASVPYIVPKVDNPWVRPGGTWEIRLCLWQGSLNLLREHFALGAGLSGFKDLYGSKYFTCDAEPLEYPHNLILNFWTETGFFGLLAFLGLIFNIFWKELRKTAKGCVRWGLLGGFLFWLVQGLADVPYFKNDLALIFWVMIALGEASL